MNTTLYRWIAVLLLALGLAASGYLLSRHVAVATAQAGGPDVCSALFGSGCDTALSDPMSIQLGLPLAGWGVLYFGVLLACLVFGYLLEKTFEFDAATTALFVALPGLGVSAWLMGAMLVDLDRFCPMCAVTHVANLGLVFLLWRLSGRSAGGLAGTLGAALNYLLRGKAENPARAHRHLFVVITLALVAVVLYQWVFIRASTTEQQAATPGHTHEAAASVPVSSDDPVAGPPDAPVRIVVFSDFACPACRYFSQILTEWLQRHAGKLHVTFKHFPLGTLCNPYVRQDVHPRACEAAWAAEAARRQGRFLQMDKALFAADLSDRGPAIQRIAHDAGLNMPRFEEAFAAQETRDKVRMDIELALRLGVNSTPAIFINGRKPADIRRETLEALLADQLRAASNAR